MLDKQKQTRSLRNCPVLHPVSVSVSGRVDELPLAAVQRTARGVRPAAAAARRRSGAGARCQRTAAEPGAAGTDRQAPDAVQAEGGNCAGEQGGGKWIRFQIDSNSFRRFLFPSARLERSLNLFQ